jgi:hypothetical protein
MAAFKALEPVVHAAPDQQVSLTDLDARSMATSGRGSGEGGKLDAKEAVDIALGTAPASALAKNIFEKNGSTIGTTVQ